jgi:hypothetical protein
VRVGRTAREEGDVVRSAVGMGEGIRLGSEKEKEKKKKNKGIINILPFFCYQSCSVKRSKKN